MGATSSTYDKLFGLPVFTGMSRGEMEKLVSKARFDYHKLSPGEVMAHQGDHCGQLYMLTSGTVESLIQGHNFSVTEQIEAPAVLEAAHVFGVSQRFSHTYKAVNAVNYITLDKTEIQKVAGGSLIFRLNLINILATALQKRELPLWIPEPKTLTARIIRFLTLHTLTPTGHKVFKIKMTQLAAIVNDSRLYVSHALNLLQSHGLISLSRGKITIPDMKRLVSFEL